MFSFLQRTLASAILRQSSVMSPSIICQSVQSHPMLAPKVSSIIVPSMSYRVRAVLELRCKGCRIEKRLGRLFVECNIKPRHKQMQMISKEKQRRIYDADAERFPKNIVQLPSINKAVQRKAIRYQLRQALGH